MRSEDQTRILIVDDDDELLRALAIQLRSAGYAIETAPNAAAVIRIAVERAPDAILLDLGLPDGDGMAVLTRLQSIVETAEIPVIVITAREVRLATRAFDNGAVAFLQKPVDLEEIVAAIEMAVENHAAR